MGIFFCKNLKYVDSKILEYTIRKSKVKICRFLLHMKCSTDICFILDAEEKITSSRIFNVIYNFEITRENIFERTFIPYGKRN